MKIELKRRNPLIEKLHHAADNLEEFALVTITKIPDRLVPNFLASWANKITQKRIQEMQQQIIKMKWQKMNMEQAMQEIKNKEH